MDAFRTHNKVITEYRSYLKSFLNIQDQRLAAEVEAALTNDGFLPEPLIQFNPSFQKLKGMDALVAEGKIHQDIPRALGNYTLFRHQVEALELGIKNRSFIVTSGTGSGKSLTFLATIFNHILQLADKPKGVKAILVYPMNALINSQEEEIRKYAINYVKSFLNGRPGAQNPIDLEDELAQLESITGVKFPITFSKYTGQEGQEQKLKVESTQPDILLTNYMMLELMMTRASEQWLRNSIKDHLSFLVFDELHTYRGRQGADVSMLVRRIRGWAKKELTFIGTSATMTSGGTPLEKRKTVANVGNTIFGTQMIADDVVLEYLEPCTAGVMPNVVALRKACEEGISLNANEASFVAHPLTNWLELTIALKDNNGQLERGIPQSIGDISQKLSSVIELSADVCKKVLQDCLKWAEKLNNKPENRTQRRSFLPFRFHQFISQTSIAQVTLHSRDQRKISIKPGRYIKTEEGELNLYPVMFSRISGYDFICVELDTANKELKPRNPDASFQTLTQKEGKAKTLTQDDFKFGYVVPDEGEEFWNDDFLQMIPESWLNKNGSQASEFYHWQMPKRIYYNSSGNYSEDPIYPLTGFYISAGLRIDPTAGIIYEDSRTSENTKLMRLGSEGRSSATTILSFALINELDAQQEAVKDQKIMSFTDNRQDASLQTGHFNDYMATIRLRSALFHTIENNPDGLQVHTVAERVFETLKLKERDYIKDDKASEDADFPLQHNLDAIKNYLLYRIFQDLNRSWRYTLPNLEQTGLLQVEYNDLKRLAAMPDKFKDIPPFDRMSDTDREESLIQVLNYFRTNFSINHRMLLEARGEIESQMLNLLDPNKLWSLDTREKLDIPRYLTVVNPGKTPRGLYTGSVGPQSGLGKYIKRLYQDVVNETPDRDTLRTVLENLCETLAKTGFLSRNNSIKGDKTNGLAINGYLLRSECLVWKPGNKSSIPKDLTRINAFRDFNLKPNAFYQNLYQKDFTQYSKEFIGREHTGQLESDQRIERENAFRAGDISALFCSPTMELGIDIANLNIVHMRNVPPNPANYAQRSGRAGRSGQTALVFTYCSALSPHDQNYFRASHTMVAGSVTPPRLDLYNEELIRSHLNAFLLMKLEISELKKSVAEILDLDKPADLPVKPKIQSQIEENLRMHDKEWAQEFHRYIQELMPGLQNSWWYSDEWILKNVRVFPKTFDAAFIRWRKLFQSAERMIANARILMDDPTVKSDSKAASDAKRRHSIGMNQRDLLRNEQKSGLDSLSEFYIFRYLAAEGLIPGYNFTRLPARAYLGYKFNGSGSYVSRPRFVALREFGPNNLVYHNGTKHRMVRMIVPQGDSTHRQLKVSMETGYAFLDDEALRANNDPITNTEFSGKNFEMHGKVIEISEAEANPQERISCQEEDRVSQGYEIDYFFNYPSGIEHTKQTVIRRNGQPMLNLIFGPSTQLIGLNKQWRKSTSPGFSFDPVTGKWLSLEDLKEDDVAQREQRVKIFATETADSLYLQPLDNLQISGDQVISLSFALKRGIERLFQVEESEISVSVLGKPERPNLLIYESAQGSLGILSQLINDPLKLNEVFREAYKAMHFDIDTRDETELGKRTEKASYLDLLSYYNQRFHEQLDRHSIKEALEFLIDCDVEASQGNNDREAHFQGLMEQYDKSSATERPFLKYLYENGIALPDRAQVKLKDFYISADFVYDLPHGPVLVFCDGSIHDTHTVMERDQHQRELLYAQGYDVIVWHHSEPIEALVNRRKDVFRKVL